MARMGTHQFAHVIDFDVSYDGQHAGAKDLWKKKRPSRSEEEEESGHKAWPLTSSKDLAFDSAANARIISHRACS